MFPDFPKQKKHMANLITNYLRRKVREDPLMGQMRHFTIHEGNSHTLKPFDSKESDKSGFKKLSSDLVVSNEEIIKGGPEAFIKHIDVIAEEMIRQQSGMMIQKVNEITKKTGNVVEGKGAPFSPDVMFKAMEKMQIDFGLDGKPKNLVLVLHPKQWEQIKEKLPEWESDPEYKSRLEKIMGKKRKEFVDRENNRKLVD